MYTRLLLAAIFCGVLAVGFLPSDAVAQQIEPTVECITPEIITADRTHKAVKLVDRFVDDQAATFMRLIKETFDVDVVADTVLVFNNDTSPSVLQAVFVDGCYVGSGFLSWQDYNEFMEAMAVPKRKNDMGNDTWPIAPITEPSGEQHS